MAGGSAKGSIKRSCLCAVALGPFMIIKAVGTLCLAESTLM
jgi:hypothetical protein